MSNIIDSIQLSGVTYGIKGSGGTQTIELTQAQYDALVDKDPNTFYVISDAQAGDLTNYYTKSETNTLLSGKADTATTYTKTEVDNAITAATSTKQDTLVSAVNIKTINNTSILGSGNITIQGGSGTYTAGRGINITNDEISVSLPISAGTGTNSILEGAASESTAQNAHAEGEYTHATGRYSHAEGGVTYATNNAAHAEGYSTYANGNRSHAEGSESVADGNTSHAEGKDTRTKNFAEHASGAYNVSSSASTTFGDSGNTLFSVGNGTADNARHNAFEIRQNGDIYITSGGTDIKLQDNLGGGGGGGGKAVSAGTNISITTGETADTINCTVPASASSGNYSIMFGQPISTSDASGSKTITGGQWSKAFSEGAVSIGQMNEARGTWSWAIGNIVKTNGKAAFACGDFTSANANYAFSEGTSTTANTQASHAAGSYTSTKNRSEFSIGEYNNSVSASTTFGDSGNTLFSVGNGTADSARHNAFEIRQNGDIYITINGQDVKLQDILLQLSGTTS